MFSVPPATTHSASPMRMACAASATVLSPLPHTLLMVVDGTDSDRPAPTAVWRAAFCPSPAWSTLPMSTSSTLSTLARRSTSSIAIAPRRVAGTSANTPPNVPTGVRAALTMTASSMRVTLRREPDRLRQLGPEGRRVPRSERGGVEVVSLWPAVLYTEGGRERAHPPGNLQRGVASQSHQESGEVRVARSRGVGELGHRR